MSDLYEPTSQFLRSLFRGDVPLSGSEFADANLALLIQLMRDPDLANRDWATFSLALTDFDTEAVRKALLIAATDEAEIVRAEAIWGLARRDPQLALPLVHAALRSATIATPILEAAALIGSASFAEKLRFWAAPRGDPYVEQLSAAALSACEKRADFNPRTSVEDD